MPIPWSRDVGRHHWDNRFSLLLYPKSHDLNVRTHPDDIVIPESNENIIVIAKQLEEWILSMSWDFCPNCFSLITLPMLPMVLKSKKTSKKQPTCNCVTKHYRIPEAIEFPEVLTSLNWKDNKVLSPFDIDCGRYVRKEHGYRQKTGIIRLTCSEFSVEQKILNVSDLCRREKLFQAYNFLMESRESSYRKYVNKRLELIRDVKEPNTFEVFNWTGIECALWPLLYPFTNFCDTSLSGTQSRESSKMSFLFKCFSQILDYSMHFDIMQFVFDRWLFKTITGAINTSRMFSNSSSQYQMLCSLEGKPFSTQYWKWQHRYLVDAVRQFGFPSIFLTISPFEWTFTRPHWLQDIMDRNKLSVEKVPMFLTLHFLHILEQIVRGYLCGKNDASWKNHIFNHTSVPSRSNIQSYFYRFEFQKRGTVHIHALLWIKNVRYIQFSRISGDIPNEDSPLSQFVNRFQKSDRSSLPISSKPTHIVNNENGQSIMISHSSEAVSAGLRAYIDTVLPALKCQMDVQTGDGNALLLKYVSSYVTKCKESYHRENHLSANSTPALCAFKYLASLDICEAEMWALLTNKKISWSDSSRKKYRVPNVASAATDETIEIYYARPRETEEMSLLEFLRHFDTTKTPPAKYKDQKTVLVGLQYLSLYNIEYFFQLVLMNYPHRQLQTILSKDDKCPKQIKHFITAKDLMPEFVDDVAIFKDFLSHEGHNMSYIETACSFLSSLNDLAYLYNRNVLPLGGLTILDSGGFSSSAELNSQQLHVYSLFQRMLRERDDAFNKGIAYKEAGWKRFVLVTGKPGTGKSQTIIQCINYATTKDYEVCIATPTGILACTFAQIVPENVHCETLHSLFHFSDNESECRYNWAICSLDVILIDEISQVSVKLFQHIILTLNKLLRRPLVLLCGDFSQQQPLATVKGVTRQVDNISKNKEIMNLCTSLQLYEQFRCLDKKLAKFLDIIRERPPQVSELEDINMNRVFFDDTDQVSMNDLYLKLKDYPQHLVLSFTRHSASVVNSVIIENTFSSKPLAEFKLDDNETYPIFKGMKLLLTRNINKSLGFVNGQFVNVVNAQRSTLIVKTSNNTILTVHPVTSLDKNAHKIVKFPCLPGYCTTIAKIQGQTLKKVIVWFDKTHLPAGTAYAALSRVQRLDDMFFVNPLHVDHFCH